MPPANEVPPDHLWHYTTTPSLIKIVESGQIWATDAMYLNDSRELIEGAERLNAEAAAAREQATPDPSPVRELWLQVQRTLGSDATVELPERGPYLASFCSEGDLLSQWRAYSSGSGFAIGFSPSSLKTAAESFRGSLVKVVYDPPQPGDAGLFHAAALTVGETGSRLVPTPTALARFKHQAFREEQEWRVVVPAKSGPSDSASTAPVSFRPGPEGITPYVAIPFDSSAVLHVRVGPGGDQRRRELALKRLLEANGNSASTSTSAAPFRG